MNDTIIFIVPILGAIGLLVMIVRYWWIVQQNAGEEKMQELASYIAKGAMAFLKAEWKILSYFVIIVAILLAYSGKFTR